MLLRLSGECCPGRLAFILEGGYDLGRLAGGVSAVLETLIRGDEPSPLPEKGSGAPSAETEAVIASVWERQGAFWKEPR